MNLFKTKYRIIKVFKDDKINNIYVEYKRFFIWKRLTFNYSMANISFSSGNLSFINTYDNPYKNRTDEWWAREEQEIKRLLNKWYINYTPPKIKKVYENDF